MWTHKKFKNRKFKGSYQRLNGERVFELKDSRRTITFESWYMAKQQGWKYANKTRKAKK